MEEVSEGRGLTDGSVPSSCVHLRACLTVYPRGPGFPGALYASLCKSRGAPFGLGTWTSLSALVHACAPQSHTRPRQRLSQAPQHLLAHESEGWASRDRPRLYLLRPLQTPALRCACALALIYLAVLLQRPEGALGEELQPRRPQESRAAYWLSTFGQFNKYLEKLFNSK